MISKVTNYGGYQSYGQKPVTSLKTGQSSLDRDYYSKVSRISEDPTFIQTHSRFQTLYSSSVSTAVQPEDYVIRQRQPCFDSTGRPRTQSSDPSAARSKRITDNTPRVLFVLGGPGCGKGTQCTNLVTRQGFQHLSAGELLRKEILRGSANGELIQKLINEGKIVPAEITTNLLREEMRRLGWNKRFLIDGYPRNRENYETWMRMCSDINVEGVLFIEVSEEVMLQRVCGRREGRSDDNPEVFKKRYRTYTSETKPVIDQFESAGKVFRVDGSGSPEEVYSQICESLSLTPPRNEQPKSTAHWRTNYQAEFHQKPDIGRVPRPEWSYHQAPHIVRMPAEFYRSKYN